MAKSDGAAEFGDCISAQGQYSPNKCSEYDTKQSDDEASVMLLLRRTRRTPLLPSLPGSLWLREVALDRVLFMGQIELNCLLILN